MARTTIELQGVIAFPAQQQIQQLLQGVPGFHSVTVQRRTVIVIHDAGSQIVERLRITYPKAVVKETAE
ncbi:hypothetical protein SUGI_0103000 [Cryptomeria japonica]|nr:hypothetical protein SUGI_0102890 [Cryptomeria japonica]GLJ09161.1 hypothetical protein SUGI_0102910 [Cryptomeria japonica]GLJ09162.1 hypothetical protein SUGI_0102920 [Cryptomeria japonica]GLJ09163.1 hypothetical protein SUGI_0102930 [Cryptomeria japonica]GLJ09164.1 hypothetical protein SUGI_0102940 [Cryptomeria japonica]